MLIDDPLDPIDNGDIDLPVSATQTPRVIADDADPWLDILDGEEVVPWW